MKNNHSAHLSLALICALFAILILASMADAVNATTLTVNSASNDQAVVSANLVNQDPDPALAGNFADVRIGISNMGGVSANNVIVEVDPQYPFSLASGDTANQTAGTILGYQGSSGNDLKILKFRLLVDKNALAGTYDLPVKVYPGGSSSVTTTTLHIQVDNQASAEIIYINQVELIPGAITPMNFTIRNVGSSPLQDLTFQWENAANLILPVGSDNSKFIKYIDVGQSVDVPFNVMASTTATPDLYKIDLTLSYRDPSTNTQTTVTTKAGVYVGGGTDFDVAYSGTSSGQTSLSIANIGSVPASSVTVRIPDQQGWMVSGSRAVIIGNLNEGDYTIAAFTVQDMASYFANLSASTSGNAPAAPSRTGTGGNAGNFSGRTRNASNQSTSLTVEIDYTDSRGNRKVVTKQVSLSSGSSAGTSRFGPARTGAAATPSFWSQYQWYIIVVVLLVLIYIAYRTIRKRRLANPDYGFGNLLRDLIPGGKRKTKK